MTVLELRKRRRGKVMEDLKLSLRSLSLALTLEALDAEIAMLSLKMFCTIL